MTILIWILLGTTLVLFLIAALSILHSILTVRELKQTRVYYWDENYGKLETQRLLKMTQDQRERLNRENETLHNTLLKAMTVIENLQRTGIQGEEQQV